VHVGYTCIPLGVCVQRSLMSYYIKNVYNTITFDSNTFYMFGCSCMCVNGFCVNKKKNLNICYFESKTAHFSIWKEMVINLVLVKTSVFDIFFLYCTLCTYEYVLFIYCILLDYGNELYISTRTYSITDSIICCCCCCCCCGCCCW
jgi:hypothetical protein